VAIGHAVRGAASAALALIALEAVTTSGSGRVASFFADVSNLLARAISPDVPLIKDRRSGGTYDADGNFHPTIPDYLGGGTTTGPGGDTSGQKQNPKFVPYDPPPIGQHNPQYDNPHPNRPGGIQE
jgi:hypothetical protein